MAEVHITQLRLDEMGITDIAYAMSGSLVKFRSVVVDWKDVNFMGANGSFVEIHIKNGGYISLWTKSIENGDLLLNKLIHIRQKRRVAA